MSSIPLMAGFTFDRVFDSNTRQEDIFDFGVKTIVEGQLACTTRGSQMS